MRALFGAADPVLLNLTKLFAGAMPVAATPRHIADVLQADPLQDALQVAEGRLRALFQTFNTRQYVTPTTDMRKIDSPSPFNSVSL